MKFTVDWLKQYVDLDITTVELARRLTMLGLEVEEVRELHGLLDNVKIADVLEVKPHSNADRLTVCSVKVGNETFSVVCGAPNVKAGVHTAIALPGAILPGGIKVKKAKIRGEKSYGMLCSEKDLGISENHSGIMELADNFECGMDFVDALSLKDTLIEIDLTPNRPDCASVIGIARETAGFTGKKLTYPIQDEIPELTGENIPFSIEVESFDDCPRYAARLITDVKIGPSPWWLQKRLLAVGQRPINNVVDITNFVMLEYGQPLHAFDFKKLAQNKIVVRRAHPDEKMTTLDGVKRDFDSTMLLICDNEKPVAVAGIMGGENSEISDETTEILLESACFNPITIRRTARNLNIGTESSYRFERGVDPEGAARALERVARLMIDIMGAKVEKGGVDLCEGVKPRHEITLRVQRVNDLLGMEFTADQIKDFLTGIEINVKILDQGILSVTPPGFRVDLEREVDLIEEVARIKGFNEFPTTFPSVPMSFPEIDIDRVLRKRLSSVMTSLGFHEAINYSFTSDQHFDMLGLSSDDPARNVVRFFNPLAEDQSIMRTTLLPGLLENLCRNINRQNREVRLFEIGKVFYPHQGEELPDEPLRLTALLSGRRLPGSSVLHYGDEVTDILDVKGVAELLLDELHLPEVSLERSSDTLSYVEPDSFILMKSKGTKIGEFGKCTGKMLKMFGIKQDVFYLRLNIDEICRLRPAETVFKPLPKFPAVKWDIAVLVPEHVGGGEMVQAIMNSGEKLVEKAEIFDIYRGKTIKKNFKSVGISVTYRSEENTLDDNIVGVAHKKNIELILSGFEGQLREE